jgi:LEA14-like dessication related protein
MKNLKIFISISLFILMISASGSAIELPDSFNGYKIPKPTAEIVNFDIDSISLTDITLLFDVEISNPYPVKLKLSRVASTFYVENKQFFKTSTDKLKIRANGKETTRLFVNLKFADMANIVKDYKDKDSLECVVDMVITLPLPQSVSKLAKDVTFKFNLKKNVPAIKPEINIANFTVIKPSLEDIETAIKKAQKKNISADAVKNMFGAIIDGKNPAKIIDPSDLDLKLKVNFDVVMKNKTKAAIFFNDLNYDFKVNSSKLVDGYTKDIKNKPGEYILSISNDFSSKALGSAILKALKDGKGDYSLNGFSMVKFPDKIKKTPLKLNFNEKGVLSIK